MLSKNRGRNCAGWNERGLKRINGWKSVERERARTNVDLIMDALLNGLSISAKGELVAVLHDGKNDVTSMSLFGC